jgi:hypothetical protein
MNRWIFLGMPKKLLRYLPRDDGPLGMLGMKDIPDGRP